MKELEFRILPVDLIEIPAYAKIRKSILKKCMEHFNDGRIFVDLLRVSFREGVYRVIQDPHILAAMKKKGVKTAQCCVFQNLTAEEEYSAYLHSSIPGLPISKRDRTLKDCL